MPHRVSICLLVSLCLLPGCSRYLSGDLTRDDAAKQLNNWQSLMIRPVTFTDEDFQCGLRSGLWKYAGEPQSDVNAFAHLHPEARGAVIVTDKGHAAGFVWDLKHPSGYYNAKLQAEYFNTVTGIADGGTPSTKLVEYVWKLNGASPNKYANQALKDCFPDGSIQGKDKATFRHFDDGWRLMGLEGQYLER